MLHAAVHPGLMCLWPAYSGNKLIQHQAAERVDAIAANTPVHLNLCCALH
jgi:hypothetical protein